MGGGGGGVPLSSSASVYLNVCTSLSVRVYVRVLCILACAHASRPTFAHSLAFRERHHTRPARETAARGQHGAVGLVGVGARDHGGGGGDVPGVHVLVVARVQRLDEPRLRGA